MSDVQGPSLPKSGRLTFPDAVRVGLTTNFARFSGRARRSEYWWFSVVYVAATRMIVGASIAFAAPLLALLPIVFVIPMLSVSVRRLHDTGGQSGGC